MDWSKCFICGKAGSEDLRCPLDSLQKNGQEIYTRFLEAVESFKELKAMPVKLEATDAQLTSDILIQNRAKWHKACYLKFNKTKLQRALKSTQGTKRKMEIPLESSPKRHSSSTSLQSTCIFCGNESGQLHNCSTFNLDQELK